MLIKFGAVTPVLHRIDSKNSVRPASALPTGPAAGTHMLIQRPYTVLCSLSLFTTLKSPSNALIRKLERVHRFALD